MGLKVSDGRGAARIVWTGVHLSEPWRIIGATTASEWVAGSGADSDVPALVDVRAPFNLQVSYRLETRAGRVLARSSPIVLHPPTTGVDVVQSVYERTGINAQLLDTGDGAGIEAALETAWVPGNQYPVVSHSGVRRKSVAFEFLAALEDVEKLVGWVDRGDPIVIRTAYPMPSLPPSWQVAVTSLTHGVFSYDPPYLRRVSLEGWPCELPGGVRQAAATWRDVKTGWSSFAQLRDSGLSGRGLVEGGWIDA